MSGPRIRAVFLFGLMALAAAVTGWLYSSGSADSSAQDIQPLPFSHVRHAGELKIDCLYCHRHAEASRAAGIPSMNICLSCHRSIKSRTASMDELLAYAREERPIPWVRLQRLPDHVYFTHERHLKTGVQCVDCHGKVDGMRGTPRAASFEMGWCLTCHRQREASQDCWTCHK